eukprot:5829979-Amphidinium_carterae.1
MLHADCASIVTAAAGYGALFRVMELDSDGANNLIRAVTSNIGLLTPDTTFEQAQRLLSDGLGNFTERMQYSDAMKLVDSAVTKSC